MFRTKNMCLLLCRTDLKWLEIWGNRECWEGWRILYLECQREVNGVVEVHISCSYR